MDNFKITTKNELLEKLRAYSTTPDDDNIRIKEKIKSVLINCPEILYALHNSELETELFNEDGSINNEGEWDRYFGENSNIRPVLIFPETQTEVKNYLGYKVETKEIPKFNDTEKICQVTFVIYCHENDCIDKGTGIPRSDLIGSIIRERFNWTNYFGSQCKIVLDKEGTSDSHWVTRTITFENKLPNSVVQTINGKTHVINYRVRQ